MERCPYCGESAIIEDDSQQVCAECGVVLSSSPNFQAEATFEGTSSNWLFGNQAMPTHMYRMLSSKRVQEAKKNGLQKISQHGNALGLSEVMVEESKQMFSEVYAEHFLRRFMKFKLILASVCVYCVCRLHKFSVAIHQICEFAHCDPQDFSHVYKELCLKKGLVLPAYSTGSAIASVINKLKWDNCESITRKTQNVLHLFEKNWLVTGRSPEHIITAALFVVWVSEDFPSRRKITLNTFCKQQKLEFSAATKKRHAEVIDLLIQLSQNIPWLTADSVLKKNVILYLDDILKYQRSLMSDIMINAPANDDDIENSENDSENNTAILPPCLKKRRVDEPETPTSPEPVISHDLDGEELTEADMADSEVHNYIRDPPEMAMIEQIRLKCKQINKSVK